MGGGATSKLIDKEVSSESSFEESSDTSQGTQGEGEISKQGLE